MASRDRPGHQASSRRSCPRCSCFRLTRSVMASQTRCPATRALAFHPALGMFRLLRSCAAVAMVRGLRFRAASMRVRTAEGTSRQSVVRRGHRHGHHLPPELPIASPHLFPLSATPGEWSPVPRTRTPRGPALVLYAMRVMPIVRALSQIGSFLRHPNDFEIPCPRAQLLV